MRKLFLIGSVILLILLVGCTTPSNPLSKSNKGVGFVLNSNQGFATSLQEANQFPNIGFYTMWDGTGQIPELIQVAYSNNVKGRPIVNVNFFDASSGVAVLGFNNGEYEKVLVNIAKTYKPDYLGVGNEVNLYSGDFSVTFNNIYSAIKDVSPGTKIMSTFQYEYLNDISIINKYNSDVIGITSYPFIKGYKSSNDIPYDYYSKLSGLNKPIIFTEIGHNSLVSEEDQANFVDVFYDRLNKANIKPEIVIWGLLYDAPSKGDIWNAGLIKADGNKKLVYNKWIKNGN